MTTKLVKRYYCDHCRKGGMTKAIADHEKTCIKNPERECFACKEFGFTQIHMALLLSAAEGGVDAVKDMTPCPACTLAALSQFKKAHPESEWQEFDYKEAMLGLYRERNSIP